MYSTWLMGDGFACYLHIIKCIWHEQGSRISFRQVFFSYRFSLSFWTLQKCEKEGPSRPVDELLDRPVERVLEYRAYLWDLLDCGRKAGVDTNDLEVGHTI